MPVLLKRQLGWGNCKYMGGEESTQRLHYRLVIECPQVGIERECKLQETLWVEGRVGLC